MLVAHVAARCCSARAPPSGAARTSPRSCRARTSESSSSPPSRVSISDRGKPYACPGMLGRCALAFPARPWRPSLAGWLLALSGCFGDDDGPGPPREPTASAPAPAAGGRPRDRRPRGADQRRAVDERLPPRPPGRVASRLRDPAAAPAALAQHPVAGALRARHRPGGALPAGAQRPVGLSGRRLARPRAALAGPRRLGATWCAARRARCAATRWSGTCGTSPTTRSSGPARASSSSVSTRPRRAPWRTSWATPWWSAGPAPRSREPAWLEGLLRHCRARGCRVSFLSFHANLAADEPITGARERPASGARAGAALPRPRR